MSSNTHRFLLLFGAMALGASTFAQQPHSDDRGTSKSDSPAQLPSISAKTASMQKLPGYFNLYWDAKLGKLWLEIDKWSTEFLYQTSLPAGIGSNDIGLDRGQLGGTHLVFFERSGPKVLLIQSNTGYRPSMTTPTNAKPSAIPSPNPFSAASPPAPKNRIAS